MPVTPFSNGALHLFLMTASVCQQRKGWLLVVSGRDALNFLSFLLYRRGYLQGRWSF